MASAGSRRGSSLSADLERIRRNELRALDTYRAIEMLCGPADYTQPLRAPKPTSGLVEQQRWFMKAAAVIEVINAAAEMLNQLERRRAEFEQ